MQLFNYEVQALKYCLPYLRCNKDVVTVLKAIGKRYNLIQAVILYLLNSLRISDARGVWLDYIGAEVGALREDVDFGDYFCANAEHVNVEKRFWFTNSGESAQRQITLSDSEFINKIYAYIASNTSSGTRNEIINIIKFLTGAENVIVTKTATCILSINLIGDAEKIKLTQNIVKYIRSILANGVYLEEITING